MIFKSLHPHLSNDESSVVDDLVQDSFLDVDEEDDID